MKIIITILPTIEGGEVEEGEERIIITGVILIQVATVIKVGRRRHRQKGHDTTIMIDRRWVVFRSEQYEIHHTGPDLATCLLLCVERVNSVYSFYRINAYVYVSSLFHSEYHFEMLALQSYFVEKNC